ncbi:MAG: type II toxin-antitoxin system RelE/ParE family toxin [Planctomycetota bacterium]
MTRYAVEVTDAALAAIRAQAMYIAEEARAPENARRWLERILDAVMSLEQWPRRAARAEEDGYVKFEVRRLVVGSHLLLFTLDDEQRKVWIIGLRHGHRLPRAGDLPSDPAAGEVDASED